MPLVRPHLSDRPRGKVQFLRQLRDGRNSHTLVFWQPAESG